MIDKKKNIYAMTYAALKMRFPRNSIPVALLYIGNQALLDYQYTKI